MAETIDLSMFVEPGDAGASHMTLAVEGVACAGCIRKIESGLSKLPGVIDARVNFTQRRLAVDWHNDEIDAASIIKAIEGIGYQAYPFAPERAAADESAQATWLLKCLAVAGFAAMNVMLLSVSIWAGNVSDMTQETRDLFHWLSALIALPAAAYAGQPFFQSALRALRARQVNMDVPISIGVTLALALSVYETAVHAPHAYFDSAIMLLFFLLIGRYLDLAMRRKTRVLAGNLASLKAEFAHRLDASGEVMQVPAAALLPGDRILVRQGERLPADGTVINGISEIDESLVTGETLYRTIRAGATIYAGSINVSGALTVRVTAAGAGTLVDEVERLLDKATQTKSQTLRLADRAARYYAPVVHTAAALTAIGWLVAGASNSSVHRDRDRCPHHYLPVRHRARDPRRPGGRGRRAVSQRSHSQRRRRDRAARRGRYRRIRQDGNADAPRAPRRRQYRRSRPKYSSGRPGWHYRAATRWRPRWRSTPANGNPIPAPSRSRGKASARSSTATKHGSAAQNSAGSRRMSVRPPRSPAMPLSSTSCTPERWPPSPFARLCGRTRRP